MSHSLKLKFCKFELLKITIMKIEQLYTGCLAQGAYYIESEGEVAIIDPLREVQQYIDKTEATNAKIKYIFETHFHADFVSGHVDLAKKTGATIVYGPGATTDYAIHSAVDNEEFKIGKLTIKVLHTPGHTLESTTYLLIDETGKDYAIFSGDTLFLGDVGRPDLAIKSDLTREDLAGMLFDSLRNKIMPLADDVIVYPAHGAGSACGKNLSKETVGVLGEQKETNYALRASMTKNEFVKEVLDGIAPPPQYFAKNAMLNKMGYDAFDMVLETGDVSLKPEAFEAIANHESALVLDVRSQADYIKGHIPNSIFIGLNGGFAPWVGALITDLKQPIILVVPEGKSEEAVTRLSRVGYDNTLGYLEGGLEAWKAAGKEIDTLESISAEEFENRINNGDINILDVRKDGEYKSMHLENAQHFALDFINDKMSDVNKDKTYYIHCAGGYRSVIAASILKARGFDKLVDVAGGFEAIENTNLKTTEFICPTTL
jgi:hydroxyacylglutathione hydrolase